MNVYICVYIFIWIHIHTYIPIILYICTHVHIHIYYRFIFDTHNTFTRESLCASCQHASMPSRLETRGKIMQMDHDACIYIYIYIYIYMCTETALRQN